MTALDTFARSALFAAAAAVGYLAWFPIAAPFFGPWHARAWYLAAAAVLYVAGLGRGRADAARAVTLAAAAVLGITFVARSIGELEIGLALAIAIARSGVLYPAPALRALLREAVLIAVGLGTARALASGLVFPTALELWGFYLVQSCFFLLPSAARPQDVVVDPFEEAHRRALALLEEPP